MTVVRIQQLPFKRIFLALVLSFRCWIYGDRQRGVGRRRDDACFGRRNQLKVGHCHSSKEGLVLISKTEEHPIEGS